MINILIATALSVVIAVVVFELQQPNTKITGVIATAATFLITYLMYFGIKDRRDASIGNAISGNLNLRSAAHNEVL